MTGVQTCALPISSFQPCSAVVSLLLLDGHLVMAGLVKERVLLVDGYVVDDGLAGGF